ncbi:MAG: tRNA (cytidine(34)-2'-O)-methyltransferase [Planctomycetales bacterium]|nr:tRNA (cytidine(34)-2'-O)-methyltransferase [bacterium]UNM07488.1 MAG: tRNA (cytidine(34)-2'-O)-methyltransferase [Planctomycetales bacterium]
MAVAQHHLKVALVEPEIPHNTGAVGRSCLALGAQLHLVHPMGFRLSDEQVRRSGLDYWQHVQPVMHDSLDGFISAVPDPERFWLFTTKAGRNLYEVDFAESDWLVFGPESRGLPGQLLEANPDRLLRIPMATTHVRSLNLANAVSVALYEAWRQLNHPSAE